MVASITDKFNKTGDGSGAYPTTATVTTGRSAGASTLACDDLSGWAKDTAVHFTTYRLNSDGTVNSSTQTDWKGIVSGNTITNLTFQAGAADAGNLSGDKVEMSPNVGWANDLMDGLLTSHNQNGTLKDGSVTASKIGADAVTSAKIKKNDLLNLVYPVGAIYMSVNATNPSTILGGTWERIQDTFLLAAGSKHTAGSTGGAETHSHNPGTLSADVHIDATSVYLKPAGTGNFSATKARYQAGGSISTGAWAGEKTAIEGTSASASSLPPYLSVYVWKRTA